MKQAAVETKEEMRLIREQQEATHGMVETVRELQQANYENMEATIEQVENDVGTLTMRADEAERKIDEQERHRQAAAEIMDRVE